MDPVRFSAFLRSIFHLHPLWKLRMEYEHSNEYRVQDRRCGYEIHVGVQTYLVTNEDTHREPLSIYLPTYVNINTIQHAVVCLVQHP